MESPLGLAFVFFLLLLLVVLFLIREVIPSRRTLNVVDKHIVESHEYMTWDKAFQAITPGFMIRAPAASSPPVHDASGNIL